MAGDPSPLSSTVSAVFETFIKRIEEEKIINAAACKALKQSLMGQKLDPKSLREAMFKSGELEQ